MDPSSNENVYVGRGHNIENDDDTDPRRWKKANISSNTISDIQMTNGEDVQSGSPTRTEVVSPRLDYGSVDSSSSLYSGSEHGNQAEIQKSCPSCSRTCLCQATIGARTNTFSCIKRDKMLLLVLPKATSTKCPPRRNLTRAAVSTGTEPVITTRHLSHSTRLAFQSNWRKNGG
nr:hypothetical protein K4M19_00169 [Agrobacterium fabrum]